MTRDLKKYIQKAFNNDLDFDSTKTAFSMIMDGDTNDIQISSFLTVLQKSGIKPHHILGALDIMKSKMVKIKCPVNSMDTCGTGGDGKNSLNISTAVAFVLASKGIPIAKHGNRALTSKCGSADVLKSLKINIDLEVSKLEDCINEVGICFMFAPNHHPAMKFVGAVRQEIGIRTIFNLLGPLLNPASVSNQLVGVYSKEVFEIYKQVFIDKNTKKNVCLISGFDGNDEISLDGNNLIFTNKNDVIEFGPNRIGLPRAKNDELAGADAKFNAERIIEIFNGKIDSFYHSVCINAAFGIILNDSVDINDKNILNAYNEAQSLINSKLPLHVIEQLSKFTNK